jgi:hypothetical protein
MSKGGLFAADVPRPNPLSRKTGAKKPGSLRKDLPDKPSPTQPFHEKQARRPV